jgi:hypothetical protein
MFPRIIFLKDETGWIGRGVLGIAVVALLISYIAALMMLLSNG